MDSLHRQEGVVETAAQPEVPVDIEKWIAQVSGDDPEQRQIAVDHVRALGLSRLLDSEPSPEDLPLLPTLLNRLSRRDLAQFPHLFENSYSDSPMDVAVSAVAVARYGAQAVTPLMESLSSSDEQTIISAVEALGMIGAAAAPAVPALLDACRHHGGVVRYPAGWALCRIGLPAVPHLLLAAEGEDEQLSLFVISTLGTMYREAPTIVPRLFESLKVSDSPWHQAGTRFRATLRAIARLVSWADKSFSDYERWLRSAARQDEDPRARIIAAYAIHNDYLEFQNTCDTPVELLAVDDPAVQWTAAELIRLFASSRHPLAMPRLLKGVSDLVALAASGGFQEASLAGLSLCLLQSPAADIALQRVAEIVARGSWEVDSMIGDDLFEACRLQGSAIIPAIERRMEQAQGSSDIATLDRLNHALKVAASATRC